MSDPYAIIAILALIVALIAIIVSVYAISSALTLANLVSSIFNGSFGRPGPIERQQNSTSGFSQSIDPVNQRHTVSAGPETPSLPPQAIAPALKNPPRPKGGFGSKADSGPEKEGDHTKD